MGGAWTSSPGNRVRPELLARFGNDPDALEWARGHVQAKIDWLNEAASLPQAGAVFVEIATWCAAFMRDNLIGTRLGPGAFGAENASSRPRPDPESMADRHRRDHHGDLCIAQLGCPLCAEEMSAQFDIPPGVVMRSMLNVRDGQATHDV